MLIAAAVFTTLIATVERDELRGPLLSALTEEISMAAAVTPIKVDAETDQLISHAAHFLGHSKKEIVDAAVREYIENHRAEIQNSVTEALRQLDGTTAGSVSLLTGVNRAELDELGGFSDA